jgi:TetR/AcrR family transcriptional repressor of nem operon
MAPVAPKSKAESRSVDKRSLLIDIGTAIFTQKGFNNTALDELVKEAKVPKGSFYYYFQTKDKYAQEVIRNYGDFFLAKLTRHLTNASLTPVQRLKAFVEDATGGVKRFEFKRGCLIGNLGQEMASLDEDFRQSLSQVMGEWRRIFIDCIEEGKTLGEITTKVDSEALAQFFWSAWEGAILCSRLERSTSPLDNVASIFFDHVLKSPN